MNKTKTSPFDFLLNLFSIALLYFSAGAFISLTFSIINYAFPDPTASYIGSLTWPLAMIIILFPAYFWSVWKTRDMVLKDPEKGDLKIRRWLIYFTLFVAAAFILGNLVAIVFNFLEGELTIRLFLKSAVIFVVAGLVFDYYRNSLHAHTKKDKESERKKELCFSAVSVFLVVFAIIGGFWVTGLPSQQRLIKLDQQRVSDLSSIQQGIVDYWRANKEVPDSLDILSDYWSPSDTFYDPETGEPYEYNVTGERTFELCAFFDTNSADHLYRGGYEMPRPSPVFPEGISQNWEHGEGRYCFSRTLPELKD